MLRTYRIQNCFSTISTKILVNRYYFRDLWRILECKSLWITHIFAIYSDLSVVSIVMVISAMPNHQFWWFLVWFICRITKFFANSSDFHGDYICFFASTLAQFGYHFYQTRVWSLRYACQWLTNSLTPSCLVNFIDLTLACEDANPKLVEVCYCC